MPKMKTHTGAKKRFRSTGTGKLKFKKPGARHLLTGTAPKKTRSFRKSGIVDATDMTRMIKFMPYSK
ncbi:MAG: 50S ribosomal protein L35 [Elusimicrobia bacterium]|nr:50S ribosomal protein L35 [Elusimicrobiota bacterium]